MLAIGDTASNAEYWDSLTWTSYSHQRSTRLRCPFPRDAALVHHIVDDRSGG